MRKIRRVAKNYIFLKSFYFKRFFYFIFLYFLSNNLHAQNFQELLSDYHQIQLQKIDSILHRHKQKHSKKWLNLLPNIGYNAQNFNQKGSISIGVNLVSFSNYYLSRHRNRIEIEKLKVQLLDVLDRRIDVIKLRIDNYKKDEVVIHLEEKNLLLYQELYLIKQSQYEKNKINLEDWINFKISLSKQENSIENKKLSLQIAYNRIMYELKKPYEGYETQELFLNN